MADTARNRKSATLGLLTQAKSEDAQRRKQCVRGPAITEETSEPSRVGKRSAHPSSHVIVQLNEKWRVAYDPIQKFLQLAGGFAPGYKIERPKEWIDTFGNIFFGAGYAI